MTTAIASGGRDHFGWGVDRYLAAETFDALNQNTRATGNWKGKPPAFPEWPRPGKSNSTGRDKKRTVADVFRMFPRRAG